MMFTSPAFPFIVFVCVGLTDAAHSYDALPLIRKSREVVKEHLNAGANGSPGHRSGTVALTPAPAIAAGKPIDVAVPAATTEPTPFQSDLVYVSAFEGRKLKSVAMKTAQMSDDKAERSGVPSDLGTTSENSQGELKCVCKRVIYVSLACLFVYITYMCVFVFVWQPRPLDLSL